jgi:hypothetical protein
MTSARVNENGLRKRKERARLRKRMETPKDVSVVNQRVFRAPFSERGAVILTVVDKIEARLGKEWVTVL